jgi:phage gpG-like protein
MAVSYPPGKSPADLQRKLSAMAARTQDMTPAMKVGAEAVKRLITMPYNTYVSPGGVKWKLPLAPSTIKKRRKGSASPLNDSGDLKRSTNTASGARSIFFFATAKYAGYQQFGTRTIPARPFLPITRDGELVQTGQAGVVFGRIFRSVGNYIVNGKVV